MTSLLDSFQEAVARHPDHVAIVDGTGHETTFSALQMRSERLANAWRARGVRSGDRVLLAMRVDADLYAALAALWSLGATVVLPEPAMGLFGLRHAARVSGVSAFCSSGAYGVLKFLIPELWTLRHLRPKGSDRTRPDCLAPKPDDLALISFTSGTSGAPKAIPRSHSFLAAQHRAVAPLLQSDTAERDLVAFPVFVLINIASGRTSILPNWKMARLAKLTADGLQNWVTTQRVTRVLLPPALCEKLAKIQIPERLTAVFTGGGPVFPDVVHQLQSAKPGLQIHGVYGSTEAEPIAHLDAGNIPEDDLMKMQTGFGLLVGTVAQDTNVRIVDHEIQVAGDHVNAGYLDPRHDAENKVHDGDVIWHRTGDAGYFDAQKRLWLLGRIGSQVDVAGKDVFPFALEVAVRQWIGVGQCALVSVSGAACLVIEGDTQHLDLWHAQAAQMGVETVTPVAKIPMDKRHASKVDRVALIAQLT
ncbi:MAG: AMP-binding protein [Halocynthiibacter sp.]